MKTQEVYDYIKKSYNISEEKKWWSLSYATRWAEQYGHCSRYVAKKVAIKLLND